MWSPFLILVPFSLANIDSQLFIIHKVSFHFLSVRDPCSLSVSSSHLQSPSNPQFQGTENRVTPPLGIYFSSTLIHSLLW